jgi:hypothetical protein
MLSQAVKKELESERDRLRAIYKRVGEKLDALEKVLSPQDGFGFFGSATSSGSAVEVPVVLDGSKPAEGAGLREFMKAVLCPHPQGLKASEVAKGVQAMGYTRKAGSKTSLLAVVRGDLSRLKREGKVKKEGAKYIWPLSTSS